MSKQVAAKLNGKAALVTGAAMGMGAAISEVYAKYGAKLCMIDMSPKVEEKAEELRKKHGAEIITRIANVTTPEDLKAAAEEMVKTFGRIDVACCNAGVCRLGNFL